jgi:hypothetical protein
VAIIRPGPIVGKMMHLYMWRRQKKEPVSYPHPSLESTLKRTLGLFQEQLLRMAMVVANFSGAAAEELRRAVGMRRSWERMIVPDASNPRIALSPILAAAVGPLTLSVTSLVDSRERETPDDLKLTSGACHRSRANVIV